MRQCMILCTILVGLAGCTSTHSRQSDYGPTLQRKSAMGYQLINRRIGIQINGRLGIARQISPNGLMGKLSVWPSFSTSDDSLPVDGYVESRDEETWQYFGCSKDGKLEWRIIYCLYYDQLNVTYIVRNRTEDPIDGHICLRNDAHIAIQPFNETAELNAVSTKLHIGSDNRRLMPGERMNFATRWKLDK